MEEQQLTEQDKKDVALLAEAIYGLGGNILNERPEGMPYELFRKIRAAQTRVRKARYAKSPNKKIAQLMPTRPGYNWHSLIPPSR